MRYIWVPVATSGTQQEREGRQTSLPRPCDSSRDINQRCVHSKYLMYYYTYGISSDDTFGVAFNAIKVLSAYNRVKSSNRLDN